MNLETRTRLAALEQQLAELTRRIYRIEQILAGSKFAAGGTHPPESDASHQLLTASPIAAGPSTPPAAALHDEVQFETGIPAASPIAAPHREQSPWTGHSTTSGESPASPSLESVVGGQWLNRLGILAVLVGISYFLKLAFENNWIGPAARILIGLLCGIGLLVWSERFRSRGFTVFAYSLKAIGLGTLYLSLWASSQFYHLVPPLAAFAGMVAVTLTSATLSLLQDSELLAAGALVGGFLTPILVSSNQNQEVALLSYLLLLDLGAFWIVWEKRWPRLLPGAFAGTALLGAGWASAYYNDTELTTTLVFATLFFLLFGMTPFIDRIETTSDRPQGTIRVGLILANAVAYFGMLFEMLYGAHRESLSWFLVAVAGFYFAQRRMLQRQGRSSSSLDSLLLILTIAFITLSIPVALDGHWITLGWDLEAAVLLWLAHQTNGHLLRLAGSVVLGLAVLRLITNDQTETLPLFNARFGLYLLTMAVSALLVWVSLQLGAEDSRKWAGGGVIVINLLALGALSLELRDYFFQLLRTASNQEFRALHIEEAFGYSALWIIYGAALMTAGFLKREAFLRWQAIVLLCAAALKVFFSDIATLDRGYRIAAFIALGIVLLAVSFFYQRMRTSEARR